MFSMKIKKITRKNHKGKVYNIGVENNHNYFANGILVSNCYMDSRANYKHTEDIIQKLNTIFEPMSQNERPFTIAIGGGEPTTAPQFCEFIKAVDELGIVPNYTTNGMFINKKYKQDILNITEKFCGGVAVSTHPHLIQWWYPAVKELLKLKNTEINFHHIISDRKSIDYFIDIFDEFKNDINHFVLLPYIPQGRAIEKSIDLNYLSEKIDNHDKLAFGAGFYNYLKQQNKFKVSLYEPELLSKFIDLKNMTLYPSSFCTNKPLKVFRNLNK